MEVSKEVAQQAVALGMKAYRDGEARLWISLPEDRIPRELHKIALAVAEHEPHEGEISNKPVLANAGSLLLRVLSWADRAGVSVRAILESVVDESGPDGSTINAIEELVAYLRDDEPMVEITPTTAEPTPAAAVDVKDLPTDPILTTESPALAPAERSDFHPTPPWLVELLSKHAGDEPVLHPAEPLFAEPHEVMELLGRLSSDAKGRETAIVEDDRLVKFRELVGKIETAVATARKVAPSQHMLELAPVEDLLGRIRQQGIESYSTEQRETADRVTRMGSSILWRIDEIAMMYRIGPWPSARVNSQESA